MFRQLRAYQLIVDCAIAAVFALIVARPELESGRMTAFNALGTAVVVVLFAGALAVRRLSPALSLGIAWAGALAQMAFLRPPSPADVAIFGVLYATAAYGSRVVFWLGFASAIFGAGVIAVYLAVIDRMFADLSLQSISITVAILVAALFGLGLAWTTGALVRTGIRARENRRAQQRAEAETLAEQERVRIARDMHDVVAHSLAAVIAQADGARYAAASDPAVAAETLGTISTTARAALSDVRMLLTQLRHSQGDGPQPVLADLDALYAQVRAAGVELRVDIDPAPVGEPPAGVQIAVYRILQEALTNALRHGDGGPVSVRIAWRDHPTAEVELDVRNGLRPGDRPTATGHGLIGMGERAQLAGGRLNAADEDGEFVVSATLPTGEVRP